LARTEYVRTPSKIVWLWMRFFHRRREFAFSPFGPVGLRSIAPTHVPSRCGWLLPAVQLQIAVFGSVPTVQVPRERSSCGSTSTSKFLVILKAAPLLTDWTLMSLTQPSSWPLPLQPA